MEWGDPVEGRFEIRSPVSATAEPDQIPHAGRPAVASGSCQHVPNGRSPTGEHYQYSCAGSIVWSATRRLQSGHVVVVGIQHLPGRHRPPGSKKFETATHTSRGTRSSRRPRAGQVDVFREHHPDGWPWWDYRGGSFYKKMGLRIDLLMTSWSVTDAMKLAPIDRNERKGPKDDRPPTMHRSSST